MKIKKYKPSPKIIFVLALFTTLHLSRISFALASGVLDTSFGIDGAIVTDIATSVLSIEEAAAVATQSDGKIVVVGITSDLLSLETNIALVRYAADGVLDTTFGDNGQVTTDTGSISDMATSIAIQADGKIVVAGTDGSDILVVRYDVDGSLDASFGVAGIVTVEISAGIDIANAVQIQPDDGKIVIGGVSDQGSAQEDFVLVRLDTDGSLDASFQGDGTVTTDLGSGTDDEITDIVIRTDDGEIIAAGTSDTSLAVVAYDSAGVLDATFSGDGILTTDLGTEAAANAVTLQTDDEILISGSVESSDGTETDSIVVRIDPDGTLDTSFGTDGVVTADLSATSDDEFTAIAVTADGEILAAGDVVTVDAATDSDFVVVEYDSSGNLDASFGDEGIDVVDFSGTADVVTDMAVEDDGTIVLVGGTNVDLNEHIAVAVLSPDGDLDVNFDTDGIEETHLGVHLDETASRVAIQSDDKIVVVGTATDSSTSYLALARYTADGILDTSFSDDGLVIIDSGSGLDEGKAAVIQSDGKVLVTGTDGSDILVARYDTDGSVDTTFDTDGIVTTSTSSGTDIGNAIAIQSDGKIIVGGTSDNDFDENGSSEEDFAVIRYNTDGSLDTDFNTNGIVITDLGGSTVEDITGVAIESDGMIVAEGTSETSLTVVSYTTAGVLNTDFSDDGVVQLEENSVGNDIALEEDGKIVVAGAMKTDFDADMEAIIVVIDTNGSLDTNFGSNGVATNDIESSQDDQFTTVVVQDNGKIIAGGGSTDPYPAEDDDFTLVAFENDGTIDDSFGNYGIENEDFNGHQGVLEDLGIQSDGTIIGVGYTEDLEEADINIGIVASTPAGQIQGGGYNCNLSGKAVGPKRSVFFLLLGGLCFAGWINLRMKANTQRDR